VSNGLGVIVEMLVAILLALTIIYCISLNRRLKLLKADEQSLRATISELVTATEIAERAIAGLKLTVQECETGLGERLRSADRFTADLDRSVVAGQQLLDRLTRIVVAGGSVIAEARPKAPALPPAPQPARQVVRAARPAPEPPRGAQAVAAAAQAFAERLRVKVHGLAA
jgi:Domain of unknown function (DUF6468)